MLHIRISSPNIDIPSDTFFGIERALNQALDRFTHIIREAQVTLRDINGDKGGIDKQCSVQLRLYPRGLAHVKSTSASFPEAVNSVCDKVRHVVAKRLGRQRKVRRKRSPVEVERSTKSKS